MDNLSTETQAKVRELYKLLDVPSQRRDSEIRLVYPRLVYRRVYIGDYTCDLSAFSLRRYHFRILMIGDCLKCLTEQHERCQPDLDRLLRPYQFRNSPVRLQAGGEKIMGIVAADDDRFPISNFFGPASDFIEETLSTSFCRNVLVVSRKGGSRAPTLVVAYLMLKQGMSLPEALKQVRAGKPFRPNLGFMVQLLRLQERLGRRGKSRGAAAAAAYHRQNPFPIRTHPTSDIVVDSRPEAKPCCLLHSYKNMPPPFVYKIVDDRERDDSLYTVCAFDRQNF